YFSAVCTDVKVVLSLEPTPLVTVMIATAMPAAISPYSIAVAAVSSRNKRIRCCFKACLLLCPPDPGERGLASALIRCRDFCGRLAQAKGDPTETHQKCPVKAA